MLSRPRRAARADVAAVAILALLPTLVAVVPSLAGRPLMGGDNALQNYPLRVLVGDSIRHGHLPLFDPYLWSGTPLLAGWNAGAGFPGSWLFAVFPDTVAWTLNLVAAGVLASLGMYLFLRRLPVRPIAAFLGSLSFTFAGFFAAQNVHIGLIFGTALLPWICAGIDALARREPGSPFAGWIVLTGVALGLTVLAGDPRAVSNDGAVAAVLALAWCRRRPSRIGPFVLALAAAVVLGVGLSAAQLVPGLQFLHQSERGAANYALYGVGSLSPSWGVFALVPYLLGGNGNFGLPTYVGPLNWPEIGMSVGLLPLVAALTLPVLRAGERLRRHGGRHEVEEDPVVRPPGQRCGAWYVAGAGGILLSLGSKTPLGHVLWHLPLFGSERLQGRNIAITDFALLVLFALFVEQVTSPSAAAAARRAAEPAGGGSEVAGPTVDGGRWRTTLAAALGALPGLAAIAVICLFVAEPVGVQKHLSAVAVVADLPSGLWPYLVAAGVLAAAVTALAVGYHRLSTRTRLVAITVLSVCEVAMFAVNAGYAAPPSTMLAPTNAQSAAVSRLAGAGGRYAFYDPYFYVAPGASPIAHQLGFFDLGIVHELPSVQGYGSVVAGAYQDITATHQVGNLDLGGVSGSLFDVLDLKVLLTDQLYLAHRLAPGAWVPSQTSKGRLFLRLPHTHYVAGEHPAYSGPWLIGGGASAQWFFPAPAAGATVSVYLDPTVAARPGSVEVGFAGASGPTRWQAARLHGIVASAREPAGMTAVSVRVLDAPSPSAATGSTQPVAHVAAVLVEAPSIGHQLLDGIMQGAIATPHWHYAGQIGPLPAFVNSRARGLAWLLPAGSRNADARLAAGSASTPPPVAGEPMVTTLDTPRPAVLASSIAWTAGWSAQLRRPGSSAVTTVDARQLGPVVAVDVPPGRWTVTWVYRPRRAVLGVELSLLALGLVVLLLLGPVALRVRRAWSENQRAPSS